MREHARNYGFHSNEELMQYLKDTGYIRSSFIFDIMCSVDRKHFTTNNSKAYRDRPEVVAFEKTISAPHMHAEVLEHISENLRHGKYALDIGSGSGYLTTCMAFALGEKGCVIGIDCIPGFQNMANKITELHYPKLLENNRVEFIVWDGRRGWPWSGPYDVIHVGVAAEDIPETLIEQLAPGGCLIMPVGLEKRQVLILLKKSLNGNIQKKELMKVRYGTFVDVDLPWSSTVGDYSILNLENKSKGMLPKSQCYDTISNGSPSKKDIKKTMENHTDRTAESKKADSITTKLEINLINDSFWKSLEQISLENKPIRASQSSIITSAKIHTKDKSPDDDDTALKSIPTETSWSEYLKQSVHEHEENSDKSVDQLKVNESLNTTSGLFPELSKESLRNDPILKLQCEIPEIQGSGKSGPTVSEKMDIFEKNIYDSEVLKSKENITEKIESDLDSSDETNSVDTEINTQDVHKECNENEATESNSDNIHENLSVNTEKDIQDIHAKYKNSDKTLTNSQRNQKVHCTNESFSKSLENFPTTYEPVSYLKSSTSTIITASDKSKTQSVRDKIDFFEENFGNYKTAYSRKESTRKIETTLKESNSVVSELGKNSNEKSNSIIGNSKNQAGNMQVQEFPVTKKTITKSLENVIKIFEPIQSNNSNLFENDATESQGVQQKINIIEEKKVSTLCNIEKPNCIEKDPRENFGGVCKKVAKEDERRNLMSSEFDIFKDEIRIMLDKFLRNEKVSDVREINININGTRKIQFMSNNSSDNSEQDNNGENLEGIENIYKTPHDKKHDSESKLELRNLYELVDKLQMQYEKNIEKNIATNEEFQKRIVHCESLEKRLEKSEQKCHILIEILVKLIKKINCHEKVLNIHLTVAEKEITNKVFEKQKREKAEEKLDKIAGIISRISEETKVIGSDFLDNTTKDVDAQNGLKSNTHLSNSESFPLELNLINDLLCIGKDDPTIEDDSSLNDKIESIDNEKFNQILKREDLETCQKCKIIYPDKNRRITLILKRYLIAHGLRIHGLSVDKCT